MISEERLNTELTYVDTDITRASMVFDTLKLTIPNATANPFWTTALQDLANARSRITHLRTAITKPVPETVLPVDMPAAAPPPAPIE
jgi:hypothetical protein